MYVCISLSIYIYRYRFLYSILDRRQPRHAHLPLRPARRQHDARPAYGPAHVPEGQVRGQGYSILLSDVILYYIIL